MKREDAFICRWGRNQITVPFTLITFGPWLFSLQFFYRSASVSSFGFKDRQTGSSSVDRSCVRALNEPWRPDGRNDRLNWYIDSLLINSPADWLTSLAFPCAKLCVEYTCFLSFVTERSIDVGGGGWEWLPKRFCLLLSPNTRSTLLWHPCPEGFVKSALFHASAFDWRLLCAFCISVMFCCSALC